jgi:ParB family chromosome partitioning protein
VSEKRRGLGRGLGALIPSSTPVKPGGDRPVDDVFFRDPGDAGAVVESATATATAILERPEPAADQDGTLGGDGLVEGAQGDAAVDGGNGPSVTDGVATGAEIGAETDLVPVPGARFAEVSVISIGPNPRQPRQAFDEEDLAELVHSIKEIGVLQPIVVRQVTAQGDQVGPGGQDESQPRYELVMGERRWRASQQAGLATIPAIIRDTSDDDLLRDALLENLHRSQLNPLEEAAAYQQLLDDFGCTHEELASRIGRSRPQISNTIRLLRLPPQVQRRLAAGVLSAGHARALLGLEDSASMESLAGRIVAEGLSVRAVEEVVAVGDDAPTPGAAPKKRPRAGSHRSELDDLAGRLGDTLDTRVSIQLGQRRGRLSIDFASVEDLNRILALMSPEIRGVFTENGQAE